MTPFSSFRERRARIRLLRERFDLAADSLDTEVGATRGFVDALRKNRPAPPPVLWDPAFLEQVYERAARDSARKLGPGLLRQVFAPLTAPEDVEWAQSADRPELIELLRAGLPRHRVRLHRPTIRRRPAQGRPARLWVGGIAAAMLVAVGAFAFFNGTSSPPELVFVVTDRPLTHDYPLAD